MKVVYCAPNRSHHYGYARELHVSGMLHAFVSGFPRFARESNIPEIGDAMVRADHIQCVYLAGLKARLPRPITGELAYQSKLWIERSCRTRLRGADLFLFYNGCGLSAAREFRASGGLAVVEAVNSHVLTQEEILREEHSLLGLPWKPFHSRETTRRVREYEEADHIVVPSEFVKRTFLARGFSEERILKVPYGIRRISGTGPENHFPRKDDEVFRILYVGALSVRKGIRYLLQAFAEFRHPRKELWLVGPKGSPSGLEGIPLPEGASWLGVLKGERLQEAYRSATLFCLPTLEEGLALVMAEALGNGIPVVATENSGAEDLYQDSREGVITPIRDVTAMKEAFERAAQDPVWLADLVRNAQLRARELAAPKTSSSLLATTLMALHSRR